MKYPQQNIAEELFEEISNYFKENELKIDISTDGVGVHWNCSISAENRRTVIHCFEYQHYEIIKPEYLIEFREEEKIIAWGRTFDRQLVLYSCEDWIQRLSLELIYDKHSFVDYNKRAINGFEEKLITVQPKLKEADFLLESPFGSDLHDYSITYKDRSCILIELSDKIKFSFQWDDCTLFEVENKDVHLISNLINDWILLRLNPSELEKKHDWIKTGRLAAYYENNDGITGEFIDSWDKIEEFYKRINEPFSPKVLHLISRIREQGFDKTLRAGQSLYNMLISRSRRHGLEDRHVSIMFSYPNNRLEITNIDGELHKFRKIKYNKEIESFLKELEKIPID
jgi:hypothetical protein